MVTVYIAVDKDDETVIYSGEYQNELVDEVRDYIHRYVTSVVNVDICGEEISVSFIGNIVIRQVEV